MYRKMVGGDLSVCSYGLSGSNSFTNVYGILYQNLQEHMVIELSELKIICQTLKACEHERETRCRILGKPVDTSPRVPHIFAIQVDIFDWDNPTNSIPLLTDDIFDPGTYGIGHIKWISPEGDLDPDGGERLIVEFITIKPLVKQSVIYGCFSDPNSDWCSTPIMDSNSDNSIEVIIPEIPMGEGELKKTILFQVQSELGARTVIRKLRFRRRQRHIETDLFGDLLRLGPDLDNYPEFPSGNALPNDPTLAGLPNALAMPGFRPEPNDDQDLGDIPEMAITESPSDEWDDEEPDDFQPGVQMPTIQFPSEELEDHDAEPDNFQPGVQVEEQLGPLFNLSDNLLY
ncbi:uncharacterized protein [Watersipora subatra]|uniref:uncharacterized protein isoform X2 n=1 Tax=Watersipora subatra TaxID=2589382 RepID=UPI00355C577B